MELLESGEEPAGEGNLELETLKQIQAILYSTEEGFEVPEGQEVSLLRSLSNRCMGTTD